jgi:hypothetical protein
VSERLIAPVPDMARKERIWWAAEQRRRKTTVPGRPLAAAVDKCARRGRDVFGRPTSRMENICKEIGFDDDRYIRFWRTGGRDTSLKLADKTLIVLGLLWFDVWNEDTVRRPLIEVRCYQFRDKLSPRKERRYVIRELTRRDWYGDAGTDWAELARVEALMTGEPLQAAA